MSNFESNQPGFDNVAQQVGSDQNSARQMVDMTNPNEFQNFVRPLDSQSQSAVSSNGQLVFDNPYAGSGGNGWQGQWSDGNAGGHGGQFQSDNGNRQLGNDIGSGNSQGQGSSEGAWGNGGGWDRGNGQPGNGNDWGNGNGWGNGGAWDNGNGQSGNGGGTANDGSNSSILAAEVSIAGTEVNAASSILQDFAALQAATATTDNPNATTGVATTTDNPPASTTATTTTSTDTQTTSGDSTVASNPSGSSASPASSSQILSTLEQSDPNLNQAITDATNGTANTAALSAQGLSDLDNAIVATNPTANPNLDAAAVGQAISAVQNDTSNPNAATDASNLQAVLQTDMPTALMMANLQQNDPTLDQTLTTAATELSQQGNSDLQQYVLNNYGTTSDSQLMSNAVAAVQGDTSNANAANDASALQTLVSESNLSTTTPGTDSGSTSTTPADSSSGSASTTTDQQILQEIDTTLVQIGQELATISTELEQIIDGSGSASDSTTSSNQSGSSTAGGSTSQVLSSLEQSDPSLNQALTDAANGTANTPALSAQGMSDLENAIVANNPTANPNLDAAAVGQAIAAVQDDTSNPNAATDASNLQAILQTDMPTALMMANLQQNDPTLDQTLTTAATALSQQGNADLQQYVLNNYGTTSDSQLMTNAVAAVQGDTSNPNATNDASELQTLASESNLSSTTPGSDSNATGTTSSDGTMSPSQVLSSLEQSDPSLNQALTDAANGTANTAALSAQGLSDLENAIVANNPTANPNLDAAAVGQAITAVQNDTSNPNAAADASNLQAILGADMPAAVQMNFLQQNDPTLAETMTTAATDLSQQGNTDLQQYVFNNYGTTSDSQLMTNAVAALQGDTNNPNAANDASALQTLLSESTLSTAAPGTGSTSTGTSPGDCSTSASGSSTGANLDQQMAAQFALIQQQLTALQNLYVDSATA